MLTIREPITLKVARTMKLSTDVLANKIEANYRFFPMKITAQEILHLVTSPPQIFLAQTQEVKEWNQVVLQDKQMHLHLTNHFLNRLILEGSEGFTYQDQVFITMVLQKLGIRDSREFMKEFRKLREETKRHQIQRFFYQVEKERMEKTFTSVQAMLTSTSHLEQSTTRQVEKQCKERMETSIYRRLHEVEACRFVYQYQEGHGLSNVPMNHWTLELLAYRKNCDAITLLAEKERVFQTQTDVTHSSNFYEHILPEQTEVSREEVRTWMAAAVLLHLGDVLFYYKKQEQLTSYLDLQTSICQSAENTLQRFRAYHTYEQMQHIQLFSSEQQLQELAKYETAILQQMYIDSEDLVVRAMDVESYDVLFVRLLQIQNLEKQLKEWEKCIERRYDFAVEEESARYSEITLLKEEENQYQTFLRTYQVKESEARNRTKQDEVLQGDREPRLATIGWQPQIEATVDGLLEGESQKVEQAQELLRETLRLYEIEGEVREQTTRTKEELKIYLDTINERNQIRYQQLEAMKRQVVPTPQVLVDKKAVRKAALRALEEPEMVLQEIMQMPQLPKEGVQTQIERQLAFVDDATRRLYESVLNETSMSEVSAEINEVEIELRKEQTEFTKRISKESQVRIHESEKRDWKYNQLIEQAVPHSQTNLWQYQKSIQQIQEFLQTFSEMNEIKEGKQLTKTLALWKEESTLVIEPMKKQVVRFLSNPIQEQKEVLQRLVHKKMQTLLEEEDIKEVLVKHHMQTSQQRIDTQTETEWSTNKVQEIQKITKDTILKNQDIIEEIMNANLSGQFQQITDQVYKKMEKRLLNERKRRGF